MQANQITSEVLISWVCDAREKTLMLHADLSDEQMLGPELGIVNPPLWEIGHVSWFMEKWVLRHVCGLPPLDERVDEFYDSATVRHDDRWHLPLLTRERVIRYLHDVRDAVCRVLEKGLTDELRYFTMLSVFHEDMHTEAFTYTRQTLGYSPPPFSVEQPPPGGVLQGDAEVPGGKFFLGSSREEVFVFDNEKWAHEVTVQPFHIARSQVTQGEFLQFVEAGGYENQEFWSKEGWAWREKAQAKCPLYWKQENGEWLQRVFNRWLPLFPNRAMIHVNYYEAEAYCRWAKRRLPTEAEREMAASWEPETGRKRRYPWGDEPPTPNRANLDWHYGGVIEVGALQDGDSPFGCRQMLGNSWEWTSSTFAPYPGFTPDPYKEYSQPWFYDHKILRGGAWTTRSRLIRNAYRNFYRPDRRDVLAGFRTCAL